jgi:hypothetical protein
MGSGYRTFTAGEVLTASNVQNYLQDQAVMVFAGTAARSSAIGTANFEEGMLTYLTDVDKLQVYTGATFADVYPAAASTQGLTLINTTSFSAVSSQALPAATFSSAYKNYRIVTNLVSSSAPGVNLNFRLRVGGSDNSTASSYTRQYLYGATSSVGTSNLVSDIALIAQVNTVYGTFIVDVFDPFETKTTKIHSTFLGSGSELGFAYTYHNQSVSYDSMNFIPSSGTITGATSVYAYNL